MTKNICRGMFRIWVVLSVLWIGGMGWYQYNDMQKPEKDSITIALSKDSQFRIDAGGISKVSEGDKNSVQMHHIAKVLLPPFLLLALFPIGAWLARGFKSESNK